MKSDDLMREVWEIIRSMEEDFELTYLKNTDKHPMRY